MQLVKTKKQDLLGFCFSLRLPCAANKYLIYLFLAVLVQGSNYTGLHLFRVRAFNKPRLPLNLTYRFISMESWHEPTL